MKKLLLLLFVTPLAFSGCSDDDRKPVENSCMMKVMTLGRGGVPGEPVIYHIEYGTSYDDTVYTQVSQEVYDYYYAQYQIAPHPQWKGEVTE